MRYTPEQIAAQAADDAQRAQDYEQWRRANWERAATGHLHAATAEIERLRRLARTQKIEYDAHVEHLTSRIVLLSKSLDDAEARIEKISLRERARRATEAETAKRVDSIEKATVLVADAVAKHTVTKAKPRGVRKTVIRDANNRITEVREEPIR